MNAIESKINYFKSRLAEVRRAEMDYKAKVGKYDEEFQGWLKEQGLPEQLHILDLIEHFAKKKSIEVLS